ncbi:HintC [Seminavis robusta]|uniref:HintC n=1 Tax=Seminavis robusta TaxID=568900 RepID=A0A9N8DL60_9STRA|nr:HintC [Seminavis robusta]|eukprot:Sro140_g065400.1 HintC (447) ;mRNA; r:32135-33818
MMKILLPLVCLVLLATQPVKGEEPSEELSNEHFMKVMEGGPGSVHRQLAPVDKGCVQTGCNSNSDCGGFCRCNNRVGGDPISPCCSGSVSGGQDYCVTRQCDWLRDDHRNLQSGKLMPCDLGCGSDGDCHTPSICWKRKKGDDFPSCCTATQVHVLDRGMIDMRDLQVGDHVLTKQHQGSKEFDYQPVYGFAHKHPNKFAQFVQIHTTTTASNNHSSTPSLLELTKEHLVYVQDKPKPVRADTIQVGDILQGLSLTTGTTENTTTSQRQHVVTKISTIHQNGLYAPLTKAGNIVVANGIVASNYIALQQQRPSAETDEGYVELSSIGTVKWLHQVDVIHLWMSPFRLVCAWNPLKLGVCHSYNVEGLLPYASWGIQLVQFMDQQSLWAQLLVLMPLLMLLSVFMAFELALDAATGAPVAALVSLMLVFTVALLQRQQFTIRIQKLG